MRDIQILEHKLVVIMDMINLLVATTLTIEIYEYYQYGIKPKQLPKSYFFYYISLNQSSQTTYSSYGQFFQSYHHYKNYYPNLYTHYKIDNDDFEPLNIQHEINY